jgi:hypothetical protein
MKGNATLLSLHTILLLCLSSSLFAQTGIIKGLVVEAANNEPVPFATVAIDGTTVGVTTDIDGNYALTNLEPGLYNISISFLGLKTKSITEIQVSNSKPAIIDVSLEEETEEIGEIVVKASPFKQPAESPVSLQTIGTSEIQRNPGGNRDISKVIRILPGVTSSSSFRNDLLIRGGGPSENRFYLDDVEVPNINHFATQGASGGPNGLINVDFIREVDFYSGAFPANRGNTMSSVFNFKQKNGRDDRLGFTATVGSSDLAATMEGPIGKKTTFLFSVRQSYLQFLFEVIGLPFLPIYNDVQFKVRTKFDTKNEFYVVGLSACDRFRLNLNANETEEQRFQLERLPVYFQWNYTLGAVYKHYTDNGVFTAVLSRNMLNNDIYKYKDNDESQNRIIDYSSQESENKLRLEHKMTLPNQFIVNYGVGYQFVRFRNSTRINFNNNITEISTDLNFHRYAAFAQVSKKLFSNRLVLSTGFRMDGNSYNSTMANPLPQFSPRFSASFAIIPNLTVNFNTGIYYQLPSYTTLGYQVNDVFLNKDRLNYTRSAHFIGGVAYTTKSSTKFSLEGYYKIYSQYPFLLNEQVSLANFGADFGVVGDAPISSTGAGRTYGLELLVQQRLYKGFYGILAYTLGWSEFTNGAGEYIPSSWDSRHILNLALGKTFNTMNQARRDKINEKRIAKGKDALTRKLVSQTLDIGTNIRFQTGLPLTPFDEATSALVTSWDRNRQAVLDFDQLNALRQNNTFGIDVRIDYKWFFPKWSFNLYLDLQNLPGTAIPQEVLLLDRDAAGNAQIVNQGQPNESYLLKRLDVGSGLVTPTIGVIVQY